MKQRVSRRNGRTSTPRRIPISHVALCAISLAVLVGGASSLSWALQEHEARQPQPAAAQSRQASSQPNPYDGIISSGTDEDDALMASPGDATAADQAQQGDEAASTQALAPEPSADDAPNGSSPPEASNASSSAPAQESAAPAQRSRVVHHTAAREETTYRTVHHQASTPREVTVGGVTRIEWTSCPVCGQRHDSAYNERLVDHVNKMGCAACGAYHDASYDETVYY